MLKNPGDNCAFSLMNSLNIARIDLGKSSELTKAEDKNMAVGCASIISRYIFLKEFDKMCDEIHMPLPKGAGKDVDEMGEEVVEKYGEEKLQEIAKVNFKNTDRILHTLIY